MRSTLLGLLPLLACACGSERDTARDVHLQVACESSTPSVGPTTFLLTLTDPAGGVVQGADVAVEGNMAHAGMVPVLGTAQEVEPGQYQVELDLTMGGDWFLIVEADLPDGRSLERTHDLPGVRSRREH